MLRTSELKISHSTVLTKNGRPYVAVMIERGRDVAEGGIPDCKIVSNQGFSSSEVEELEELLHSHKMEIIDAAKGISKLSLLLR